MFIFCLITPRSDTLRNVIFVIGEKEAGRRIRWLWEGGNIRPIWIALRFSANISVVYQLYSLCERQIWMKCLQSSFILSELKCKLSPLIYKFIDICVYIHIYTHIQEILHIYTHIIRRKLYFIPRVYLHIIFLIITPHCPSTFILPSTSKQYSSGQPYKELLWCFPLYYNTREMAFVLWPNLWTCS